MADAASLAGTSARLGLPRIRSGQRAEYRCFVASRNRHLRQKKDKFSAATLRLTRYKDIFISLSDDSGPHRLPRFSRRWPIPRGCASWRCCGRWSCRSASWPSCLGQSQPRVSRHVRILADCGTGRPPQGRQLGVPPAGRSARAPSRCSTSSTNGSTPRREQLFAADVGAAGSGPRRPRRGRARAISRPMPRPGTASARSMSPKARSSGRSPRCWATGRSGALLDIGTGTGRMLELFAPAGRQRDRHRPLVGDASAGAGQAGGERDCAAPACARATCMRCRWPIAAPTASSSTRCCIMRSSPAQRLPRRRGCSPRAGGCWSIDFARMSARNLREQDAHLRLGFADRRDARLVRAARASSSTGSSSSAAAS